MDLQSFFNALQAGGLSNKTPVILLRGNNYPLLLCSLITDQLKRTDDIRLESVDLNVYDDAKIASKCATTFLGQRSFYWLYLVTIKARTVLCFLHWHKTTYSLSALMRLLLIYQICATKNSFWR